MTSIPKMYATVMIEHKHVTGSSSYVNIRFPNSEQYNILLDVGMYMEKDYVPASNYFLNFDPEKVDAAIITHSHADHCAMLPELYKRGFSGNTYCTDTAFNSLREILLQTGDINAKTKKQEKIAKSKKQRKIKEFNHITKKTNISPSTYDECDIENALNNVVSRPFLKSFYLTKNISVTLLPNHHLLGACMVKIVITYPRQKPITLVFSGDYAKSNYFFEAPQIPKKHFKKPSAMFIESTYGSTYSNEVVYGFDKIFADLCSKKQNILMFCFAQERAQIMLSKVKEAIEKGVIPQEYEIYVDGKSALSFNQIYKGHSNIFNSDKRNFIHSRILPITNESDRASILLRKAPKIIITTSGMGDYGPAVFYTPYFVSDKKSALLYMGYCSENSIGYKILNANENERFKIFGISVLKKCKVFRFSEFSGHAKKDELLDLLKMFESPHFIGINHGEEETKENFKQYLKQNLSSEGSEIEVLDPLLCYRIGANGLIKSYKNCDRKKISNISINKHYGSHEDQTAIIGYKKKQKTQPKKRKIS